MFDCYNHSPGERVQAEPGWMTILDLTAIILWNQDLACEQCVGYSSPFPEVIDTQGTSLLTPPTAVPSDFRKINSCFFFFLGGGSGSQDSQGEIAMWVGRLHRKGERRWSQPSCFFCRQKTQEGGISFLALGLIAEGKAGKIYNPWISGLLDPFHSNKYPDKCYFGFLHSFPQLISQSALWQGWHQGSSQDFNHNVSNCSQQMSLKQRLHWSDPLLGDQIRHSELNHEFMWCLNWRMCFQIA